MYARSSWSVTFRILNICSETTGPLEVEKTFLGMMFVRPTAEIPILFHLDLPPPALLWRCVLDITICDNVCM